MKDIKELIYAAVEGDAVRFQELASEQLQARAYLAIEALRPEVGASLFGESKEDNMDDVEDEEDEDEDEEDEDEQEMKETLHPNQQKLDVVDDNKIDAKDFAKLRKMKKEEVEQIDEVDHPKNNADMLARILHQVKTTKHPVATDAQFRATHGKDMTKKASLEPGEDKMNYVDAQGGNVKL